MTARTREDELKEVPLWKANKELWPPGVREIDMEEQDCLGIDRYGNLYWDGRPIEVRYILLTPRQTVWAVIIAVSALIGAIGAAWRMRTGLVALVWHQSDVHNANSLLCRWQPIGPIFLSFPLHRRASQVLRLENGSAPMAAHHLRF
jgi:hypothetical protein